MHESLASADYLRAFFDSDHLPMELARVAQPCANLADEMIGQLPDDYELRFGLRQLLLAKDAFVRAAVLRDQGVRVHEG